MQLWCLDSSSFVYPNICFPGSKECDTSPRPELTLFLKHQVVQHPIEAPYRHNEEGCYGVMVPSHGFGGHRVLWGH